MRYRQEPVSGIASLSSPGRSGAVQTRPDTRLGRDFPHATPESRNAEEAAVGRHIQIADFHKRQAGAETRPACASIGGTVDAEEGRGIHGIRVCLAEENAVYGNVRNAIVGSRER